MSATSDALAIALPSVVALAAIGSAVWQQRRGLSHERELFDLAAVRSVLDDAALALFHAERAVTTHDWVEDVPTPPVAAAEALEGELSILLQRLLVRFGREHAAVDHFTTVFEALGSWIFSTSYLELSVEEGGPEGARRRDEQVTRKKAAEAVADASAAFLDVAAKTAGAKLP